MNIRHNLILASAGLLALLAASCAPRGGAISYEQRHFSDSTAHAYLVMNLELPAARPGAARVIREALVEVMDQALCHADTYVEERAFPRFSGDPDDTDALMDYYTVQTLEHIGRLSQSDYEERESAIRESDTLTPEEKELLSAEAPMWAYEFNLGLENETDRYAVFRHLDYTYMGGAHGGILGSGFPTFDKQDGHQVTPVLQPDCTEDIQPLLVKGLMEYFEDSDGPLTEDELFEILLFDQEGVIPLPTWEPFPSPEGLVFTYQQYEIASYAAGMPSFAIPFEQVREFLSADACRVFGL